MQVWIAVAALAAGGVGATTSRVAYRLSVPSGEPARNSCTQCGLIFRSGLAGWISARPRCCGCGHPQGPSPWVLVIAAVTTTAALAWGLPAHRFSQDALLASWILLGLSGILLSTIDIAVYRLPTPIIWRTGAGLVALLTTAAAASRRPSLLFDAAIASAALGGVYFLLALLSPRVIGLGDVRLSALLGLALGPLGWRCVVLATVLPYLVASPLAGAQIVRGRLAPGDSIPFGPFLLAGALATAVLSRVMRTH
ncbi:A24 family peptidase [Rugosimonospora acidiphila]|uniref:A24 family peptidase n=1 Tax=Rugosimonospora acidiphila TaxID=556531 RepID=A0ABP9SJ70_9ACTN